LEAFVLPFFYQKEEVMKMIKIFLPEYIQCFNL
jgi:hypothetical protein